MPNVGFYSRPEISADAYLAGDVAFGMRPKLTKLPSSMKQYDLAGNVSNVVYDVKSLRECHIGHYVFEFMDKLCAFRILHNVSFACFFAFYLLIFYNEILFYSTPSAQRKAKLVS